MVETVMIFVIFGLVKVVSVNAAALLQPFQRPYEVMKVMR